METTEMPLGPSPENPMQPVFELLQGGDPDAICSKYAITRAELDGRYNAYQTSRRRMALTEALAHQKTGRNDPCPCGSGKKYKKCCLSQHEEARRSIPPDQLQEMEKRAVLRDKLDKQLQRGFELLFSQEFDKAKRFASQLLESYPEDDRLSDILVTVSLASGDYDEAFHLSRRRLQVAIEEKTFYQENGYHKREGQDRAQLVHFYSPSTWLEKFWITQRARFYREAFPVPENPRLAALASELKAANDIRRFPARQDEGFEERRRALAPVMDRLKEEGTAAVPFLLPLTYTFSWVTLLIPELLLSCAGDMGIRLLAELSMFRFPYFSQKCLSLLEEIGEKAVPFIDLVLDENPAFDELKVGLIAVLGAIPTPESFDILKRLIEHENPYVANWVAQSMGRHQNPQALPYLEKAKERFGALSKIAGAVRDLSGFAE